MLSFENLTKSTDNNGDRTSDRYENEIVITDNDGKKEALVRKIINRRYAALSLFAKEVEI